MTPVSSAPSQVCGFFPASSIMSLPHAPGLHVSYFQVVCYSTPESLLIVPSAVPNPPRWLGGLPSHFRLLVHPQDAKLYQINLPDKLTSRHLIHQNLSILCLSELYIPFLSEGKKKKKYSNIFLHFSCLVLNHAVLTLNRWPSFLLYWKSRGHLVQPP